MTTRNTDPKTAKSALQKGGESCAVPAFAQAPSAPAGAVPTDGCFDVALACSLADLGPVSLARARDADDRRAWEAMVAAHHPQGWSRPPGGQVRYWIRSAHHAVLGGIGFGAATWQLRARDAWIGWSADARADNLGRVICNHRFLVLPQVRVQGLASRAPRLATVHTCIGDRVGLYGGSCRLAFAISIRRRLTGWPGRFAPAV